ncbi:MAG TPA: hypothetical protein VEW05_23255 [Candidatus Polarisedimenticolia bacterium]|nr:hypothetical protein [Candidatus Polarisedimenticolia bacterium]
MRRNLVPIAGLLLVAAATLCAGDRRVHLLPQLQPGQTVIYLIRFQSDKTVKTESRVIAPMVPNAAQMDAHGLLRVEILGVQQTATRPAIHARGQFLTLDTGVWIKEPRDKKPNWDKQRVDPEGKTIEFTISPDGSVSEVKGLDSLFPEQQQAWQQWVARFALAWVLPPDGMKSGEKWKSEQVEQSSTPIAGLQWARDSMYVRDEPCHASQLSLMGDVAPSSGPSDTCAVLLTTAKLKQNSSSKDATPEDFKLHELHTSGTARGTNEIITFVSLKSGLVVRATEEATQFMDVVVAKTDGSNRVHFNVDAKSHGEVLLVTETPLNQP